MGTARVSKIVIGSLIGLAGIVLVVSVWAAVDELFFPRRVGVRNADTVRLTRGMLIVRNVAGGRLERRRLENLQPGSTVHFTTRAENARYLLVAEWEDGSVLRDSAMVHHTGDEQIVVVVRDSMSHDERAPTAR